MKTTKSLLLALGLSALSLSPALASAPQFKLIHAHDLAVMMEKAQTAAQSKTARLYLFDANTPKVRQQYGVIPGARLLGSSSSYDVKKELPADRRAELVFYCANTMCTASHSAAQRAISAGFRHVFVMGDGIMGWKSAGNPTNPVANPVANPVTQPAQ